MPYFLERLQWVYFHVLYALSVLLHPRESATAVNNYMSRIKGIFPRQNTKGVIFFACDTQFMEQFGYNLIVSCYETARECGVHLDGEGGAEDGCGFSAGKPLDKGEVCRCARFPSTGLRLVGAPLLRSASNSNSLCHCQLKANSM